jgi:hypothetical protein
MKRILLVILLVILFLGAVLLVLLGVSFHRVRVVEAIGRAPLPGTYISLEYKSGKSVEVGRTDQDGKLTFWNAPLPLPLRVCAQNTFYAPACVGAVGLTEQVIELAVP